MNCYQLTTTELAAKIAGGYTLSGGPHATLAECLVACGSGPTHTTTCCPDNPIADALPITFSGCATGTGTLLYSGASDPGVLDIWYGEVTLDCTTIEVILQCESGVWLLLFGPGYVCEGSGPVDSCDPFCLEFTVESLACIEVECPACEAPATLTIQIGAGCGMVSTLCCPDDPISETLTATVSGSGTCDGDYVFTYSAGSWTNDTAIGTCGTGALILTCTDPDFQLDVDGGTLFASASVTCSPLSIVFNAVTLNALCGCASTATITFA